MARPKLLDLFCCAGGAGMDYHQAGFDVVGVDIKPQQNVIRNRSRLTFPVEEARRAMGIDWMTMAGLSQAIPPAYTRWIGERLLNHVRATSQVAA